MNISIIGLGLIGGSFGLALKNSFDHLTIFGWDNDSANLNKALDLGLVDHGLGSLDEALRRADRIYLAIPVDAIEALLPEVLNNISDDQCVIDFGSTKGSICEQVKDHPRRHQFVAAHPIAGTEYSGPDAAFAGLLPEKVMIICDREMSEKKFIDEFEGLCTSLQMKTAYLNSEDHDRHLAYVSHLSHAIAYGLSNTVLEEEKSDNKILELAGSGFASTVRLAKSSPDMWTPIFFKNRKFILEGLENYLKDLNRFRDLLEEKDVDGLHDFLNRGREIRKILE